MSARTVIGEIAVWLTPYDRDSGPAELASKDDDWLVRTVSYSPAAMERQGWTRVGTAQVTIKFDEPKEILSKKVEALKVEKQKVLADAQAKSVEIERQIQTLLAIGYDGGAQ